MVIVIWCGFNLAGLYLVEKLAPCRESCAHPEGCRGKDGPLMSRLLCLGSYVKDGEQIDWPENHNYKKHEGKTARVDCVQMFDDVCRRPRNRLDSKQTMKKAVLFCQVAPHLTCKSGAFYRMHQAQILHLCSPFFSYAVSIPFQNLLIL